MLADPRKTRRPRTEDRLRLGQTFKSQADLFRLKGSSRRQVPVFDEAVAELEQAHAATSAMPRSVPSRRSPSTAAAGCTARWETCTAAENDFRQALGLLERLVADFPTVPRHREVLARACNSLGLLEKDTGRLDDAEVHLRRQVPLARRLAEDFPDRPEYRSILGRALTNLGTVLFQGGRSTDALPVLREAIDLNSAITAQSPDDVAGQVLSGALLPRPGRGAR